MELKIRLLEPDESRAAARIHRLAGALIPDYDTLAKTEAEFDVFYRDKVMVDGPVWGAFAGSALRGFVALLPGWIDHRYIDPPYHGRGIGGQLVQLAQREQECLRLYTFQSNVRARHLYEAIALNVPQTTLSLSDCDLPRSTPSQNLTALMTFLQATARLPRWLSKIPRLEQSEVWR